MSEIRLVVREAGHDWSGTIHGSAADRAIAALGADPVTRAELEAAVARFEKPIPNRPFLASFSAGLCDEPYDAGIVVIDLVARLVAVGSTYSSPGLTGEVCYHDGHCATDTWLRYHLAEEWLITSDCSEWRSVAEGRRRDRAENPVLDARRIFYDRPLLEFIARETFAAYALNKTVPAPAAETKPRENQVNKNDLSSDNEESCPPADEEAPNNALKEIHARWLLTPRDDLGGVCPRDVALEQHNHLNWDLQHQCERWSLLGECPPGVDESSFAFRYGGFGTHELVQYYNLVRELLWSCWEQLFDLGKTHPTTDGSGAPTVGDFLTSEVPRLESVRDVWLDSPDPECHGRTPRSIIHRERVRLPEGMSGHDAMVDPDCPCCQMMADMPGPMFWHLDGSGMDDEFAFDIYHRTREEWDAERRRWEEHSRRFDAERAERKRLGLTESGSGEQGNKSVWSSSFSVGDVDVPLGVRLFGIGGHLAELIVEIRNDADRSFAAPEARRFIDQLNRDFGNLREVLQTSEPSLAEALVNPVIDRFTESLAAVASARPDLSTKCESLTNGLAKFLDPHPSESSQDSGDSDYPF